MCVWVWIDVGFVDEDNFDDVNMGVLFDKMFVRLLV